MDGSSVKPKLLTVVTASYNKGDRLYESTKSILDQTYKDFEYIVINDGSRDNTKEILDSFDDDRLRVIHQSNQGFVKTMIAVMEQVKTPYVAIHGAGDISLPERLETQIRHMESRPDVAVISCGTYKVLGSQPDYISEVHKLAAKGNNDAGKELKYTTVEQMIRTNIVDHGDAMVRMAAYRQAGGYRPLFRYSQDRDLWLRILENYSVLNIGKKLYVKVINPGSDITGNPAKAEQQSFYSLFARYLARHKCVTGKDLLKEHGNSEFDRFVNNLGTAERTEIAKNIHINIMLSNFQPEAIGTACRLIKQYAPDHFYYRSVRSLKFMQKNVPYGAPIYAWYYQQIVKRLAGWKRKVYKIPNKLGLVKTSSQMQVRKYG